MKMNVHRELERQACIIAELKGLLGSSETSWNLEFEHQVSSHVHCLLVFLLQLAQSDMLLGLTPQKHPLRGFDWIKSCHVSILPLLLRI